MIILLLAIAPLLLPACNRERPEQTPGPADTPAVAMPDTIAAPAATDTPVTTGTPLPVPSGQTPLPAPGPTRGWKRAELLEGVQTFITAIDSGDQAKFWSSLSRRSMGWIDKGELGPKQEIWTAARETLGDIRDRRITVLGGTADSVALQIDGMRMIDGVRQSDPIIIELLREESQWKVMYPGLLYPQHHLLK